MGSTRFSDTVVIAGKPAPTLCSLALAVSLAGCAGLPDQRLANEALKRGDTATAAANYQQLADLGYSEAQVGLADIQVDSRDPAQIKQAEATYRAAASVSPRAQAPRSPAGGQARFHRSRATRSRRPAEKAAANGEGNTLIPLAMLYLQYPHSFPNINAQQQISQWRAEGNRKRVWRRCCCTAPRALTTSTWTTWNDLQGRAEHHRHLLRRTGHGLSETGQPEQQAELLKQLQAAHAAARFPRNGSTALPACWPIRPSARPTKTAQSLLEPIAPGYPASWVSLAQLLYDFPNWATSTR
jgi:alginate biosynthesis protein AlgK